MIFHERVWTFHEGANSRAWCHLGISSPFYKYITGRKSPYSFFRSAPTFGIWNARFCNAGIAKHTVDKKHSTDNDWLVITHMWLPLFLLLPWRVRRATHELIGQPYPPMRIGAPWFLASQSLIVTGHHVLPSIQLYSSPCSSLLFACGSYGGDDERHNTGTPKGIRRTLARAY